MRLMGKHGAPVNGTIINGHAPALTQFTIPSPVEVRPRGPVTPWPQHQDNDAMPSKTQRVRSAVRVIFAHRGWLAAVPVILVNAVAFGAQLGFWRAHVPLVAEAVLVALALESIAVYLAWQAHLAQLADDSALRLRMAAYGTALLIGALNYSHFDGPGWRPTVEAVTFGMMSAISPWLWSVHSRRVSRDALKAKGLIEPHAVRLGGTRWAWHPWRSVCVMSNATWTGETDPAAAIAAWEPRKASNVPADATGSPVPDASADASPDAPERPQERADDAQPAASSDAKPKRRAASSAPSKRAKAKALLKANPGLRDDEGM